MINSNKKEVKGAPPLAVGLLEIAEIVVQKPWLLTFRGWCTSSCTNKTPGAPPLAVGLLESGTPALRIFNTKLSKSYA